MFTVKATYHGHTRKHTFSDTNTFPTYDQICLQLHRVFPITQNYYWSKLLFSPDAAQSSRILLSKEVHNAFDYHKCIRQFKDRTWSHALLRFTVSDETPDSHLSNDVRMLPETFSPSSGRRPVVAPLTKPSVSFQMSIDADTDTVMTESSNRSHTYVHPQHTAVPMPQHRSSAQAGVCCSVSQGKAEIKAMLHGFQEDLNRVITVTFDEPLPSTSLRPPSQADVGPTSAPPPFLCSLCIQHRQGTWYSCDNCHVVECEACHNAAKPGYCLNVMGPHHMKLVSSPNSESYVPIPRLPVPWTPRPESSDTTEVLNTSSASTQTGETSSTSSTVPPVIHRGITCDVCNKTIEGIRHKCLDCPDYDLCTPCMAAGVSEVHNPFHEFFEIREPGRVIVHTVFSGNGEREGQGTPTTRTRAPEASVAPATGESVIHYANCDLCDSRIYGDRYKCLDCPDFDTCVTCFSITNEQHPDHGFVKIQKKEDFIRRRNIAHAMHNATCNSCSKRIFGIRFKCMHPDCPDYDLCESCEAFPIVVHPSNHPMLKMRTPDTVIPTVYRVGQTSIIKTTAVDNECQTSIDKASSPESTPSGTAHRSLPPAPSVPVHNIPVPSALARSRSSSPVEDIMMRSSTPVARSFCDRIISEKGEVRSSQNQVAQSPRSPPSPTRPPALPPKPDMISHQSWASIPDFFSPAPRPQYAPSNAFFPLIGQNTVGNSQFSFGTIQGPAQPPMPTVPAPPPLHIFKSPPAPQVPSEVNDAVLPSVPNYTPNPWPTTNPTERQELLDLITEFTGSSVPVPARSPVLASPVSLNKTLERPAVTPPRNNPFLSPHSTAVELPRAMSSSLDERPTAPESQENRPSSNDPLPMWAPLIPDLNQLVREGLEYLEPKLASIISESASNVGSPLSGQVLLNRPTSSGSADPSSYPHSLAELIHQLPALIPPKNPSLGKLPEAREPLSARFVDDVTVPEGQAFPPGAEFVKCWRLLNTSERDWPEHTELVFVAGDPLSDSTLPPVLIGRVAAGAEFDVWTGELKAPDTPGRYVGYWKLKADGELFGNSLWIEINVVESDSHHSSDDSMAASSIIMPTASPSAQQSQHVPSTTVHSLSAASTIVTDDDMDSDGSSVSLISMPSSPSDDEDEALFHDSRSQTTADRAAAAAAAVTPASGMDYVMLYDDNSSSEE
ncbi:hypothetical protein BYT27DRAFT_7338708 [Phlegmacium glaucopus]|nr:hypothetical protein BYT27DRAFT_7338708 [Phlegmacium glaucopus]